MCCMEVSRKYNVFVCRRSVGYMLLHKYRPVLRVAEQSLYETAVFSKVYF